MLRSLLNALPTPLLAATVVGGAVMLAAGAVLVVRRAVPGIRRGFEAQVSSQVLAVVAAIVGLLLAFGVVVQFESYRGATDNARDEAGHLAQLAEDARTFPRAERRRVDGAVKAYARAVLGDEWPAMRKGHESALAAERLRRIADTLRGYEPRGTARIAFFQDAVTQLSSVVAARQARLDRAEDEMPGLLFVLLVVGSLITIGCVVLVGSQSRGFHLVRTVAVSAVVAFALLLVVVLAHPFSGGIAVDRGVFRTPELQRAFSGAAGP